MRKMLAMMLTLALLLTCVTLPAHAVRYCGYCGASVYNDNFVFCSMCGKKLDGQSGGTQDNGGQNNLKYSQNGYLMGYTIDRLSTRSGPGTTYSETGSYNNTKNTWVEVSCRAWDSRNEIWWVQVHIGNQWLWTGYKRFDSSTLPLDDIPVWGSSSGSGGTNNHGSNSGTGMADIEMIDPAFGWLLGKYIEVGTTGSARSGPGTNYGHKTTLLPGEEYTILDVSRGDTRKDWYKIRLSTGEEAWAASGLFLLNGVDGGTVWGVPD